MPSVRWWSRFSGWASAAASARSKLSSAGSSSLRQLGDAAGLGLRDVAARALAHVVELGHRAQVLVAVVGLGRGLGLRLRGLGDAGRGGVRLRAGRAVAAVRRGHRRLGSVAVWTPSVDSPRAGAPAASSAAGGVVLGSRSMDYDLPSSTTSASTTSSSARPARRSRTRRCPGRGLLLLGALVHRLGDLVERALQRLGLGVDLVRVLGGQALADVLDRGLDLLLARRRRPARRGP